MQIRAGFALAAAVSIAIIGCSKEEPAPPADVKPRETPTFTPSAGVSTQPSASSPAAGTFAGLPPGHPPIPGHGLPAEAPPAVATTPSGEVELPLGLRLPTDFQPRPARMMTLLVFAAPKVEGDAEDADVTISTIARNVPLNMNIQRWCGQFTFPEGQDCQKNMQQQTLEGTAHRTTVVEIAGTYKGRSMMMGGPPPTPKPGFKMVAIEMVAPDAPYYVTMVGPARTVERWRGPLIEAVKAAK